MMEDHHRLEVTIYHLEESDTSRTPSPKELLRVDDEVSGILSPILLQEVENSSSESEKDYSEKSEGFEKEENGESNEQIITQLKDTLADRESQEDNSLLQHLKAMKEEVWAKRKARRMRKELKKVKFQEENAPTPFSRSCCVAVTKARKAVSTGAKRDGESETGTFSSGESSESSSSPVGDMGKPRKFLGTRPVALIHSINMYQNIIPKHVLQNRHCGAIIPTNKYMQFGTPLAKMLKNL